ncbi:MAG: hypothetical protein JOZ46_01405 [Candidatus Dormibacteraeota bacterium]|nr:hypothetical protein [Candidatus Dormibacteraeota bacterium]MBV9524451.1 hypothetical protein [Candidatus Dormibacteraeota bacterium]
MSPVGAEGGLGVFVRDWTRSVVVLSEDGEIAVALRDCVDTGRAVVRDVRPAEFADVLAACRPWPWMVVGGGGDVPPALIAAAAARPFLVFWYGTMPAGLPAHARPAARFSDLAGMVNSALQRSVGGMSLSPGMGVDMPHGRRVRSAALEALIAAHPDGFDLPLQTFRSATRVLHLAGVPFRPRRDRAAGGVVLRPMAPAQEGDHR